MYSSKRAPIWVIPAYRPGYVIYYFSTSLDTT